MEITELVEDWRTFYRRQLDIEMPASVIIPQRQTGFDRLIIIPPGLTHRLVLRGMAERFGLFSHYDVYEVNPDLVIAKNDRNASTDIGYGVWIRDNVDADEEFANLSADDVLANGVLGITLLERLVLELKHFVDTGRHLDVATVTLCTGTRHHDGCVPWACWESMLGRFNVDWYYPHVKRKQMRCRAVVA